MCGIIGYCGWRCASDIALDALGKLSYRGYDSAGIAVSGNDGIAIKKAAGKIDVLKNILDNSPLPQSKTAIGHTRWATHGAVSDKNSHPHGNGRVMIVHNGIIENYLLLRAKLEAIGYEFQSETDTEAAALLIDYLYDKYQNKHKTITECCKMIRGSYAILVLFADSPEEIWCVRHESPLLIGVGEKENFISSDIPAFLSHTNRYFRLNEGEIAKVTENNIYVYTETGELIERNVEVASFDAECAKKGGYEHFMRKEISDEIDIISNLCSIYSKDNDVPSLPLDKSILCDIKHISIVGCGTAYHAGIYGKEIIQKLLGIRCDAYIASEFRYSNPLIDRGELVIFISQSGETADTLSSLRMAKKKGAYTVGIVNTVGSSIASEADSTIYVHAGVEIAVASTKAYTAQCTTLALLSIESALYMGKISREYAVLLFSEIRKLSKTVSECIERESEIALIAKELKDAENLFFIGRRWDYISAIEASLKLKEISYIHSEAYPAGELKHGTISLVTDKTPVIALFGDLEMKDKTFSNLKEVSARGAKTIALTAPDKDIAQISDIILSLPDTPTMLMPIPMATILQLLAYHISRLRGCDIDQPRNLAKSVTVE